MIKILFVCHGNICRSPMAEFVLKDMVKKRGISHLFDIQSMATSFEEIGNDIHPGTKNILYKNNIPFEKRSARRISKNDYENFDRLICMDENNIRNLMRIIESDPENKVSKLLDLTTKEDVKDPWFTGNFEETYRDVVAGCNALLESLNM